MYHSTLLYTDVQFSFAPAAAAAAVYCANILYNIHIYI